MTTSRPVAASARRSYLPAGTIQVIATATRTADRSRTNGWGSFSFMSRAEHISPGGDVTYNPRTLMSLAPGARLGPYEVIGSLGAGGMGEVYRARDTKLD